MLRLLPLCGACGSSLPEFSAPAHISAIVRHRTTQNRVFVRLRRHFWSNCSLGSGRSHQTLAINISISETQIRMLRQRRRVTVLEQVLCLESHVWQESHTIALNVGSNIMNSIRAYEKPYLRPIRLPRFTDSSAPFCAGKTSGPREYLHHLWCDATHHTNRLYASRFFFFCCGVDTCVYAGVCVRAPDK